MEKCPNCQKETISIKNKLSMAPGETFICSNCNTKLGMNKKAYFIHAIYMLIVGICVFKLSFYLSIAVMIIASILSLFLIIKVVPINILD